MNRPTTDRSSTTNPAGAAGPDIITEYSQYLSDESGLGGGCADQIWFPTDSHQVAAILEQATTTRTPVTISGARTGLVGGAVPDGGIIISLDRMKQITSLSCNNGSPSVRVEAGVTIAELRSALETGRAQHASPQFLSMINELGTRKLFYPVNPTEDTAHIGGTVSTNASGSRSLRYGTTRRYVKSITVVVPTGHVISITRGQFPARSNIIYMDIAGRNISIPVPTYIRPDVKNASGYHSGSNLDLIDLFIGAEGTLGVITAIELRLLPRPNQLASALAFFPTETDAIQFIRSARGESNGSAHTASVSPMALEYFDDSSLILLDQYRRNSSAAGYPAFPSGSRAAVLFEQGLGEHDDFQHIFQCWMQLLVNCHADPDQTWGGFDDESAEILRKFRHALPEQINVLISQHRHQCPTVHKVATDMAVPPDKLETMIDLHRTMFDRSGLDHFLYGHIGQNHVHANILPRTEQQLTTAHQLVLELAGEIIALGGSPLVEHGSGRIKKHLIKAMYGQNGIDQMAAVKRCLDPELIVNRGVMFDIS